MFKAQFLDVWVTDGEGRNTFSVSPIVQAFPGVSLMDVSGEPAPVNTPVVTPLVVEIWDETGDAIAAIQAHANYGPDAFLWVIEEVTDGIPN